MKHSKKGMLVSMEEKKCRQRWWHQRARSMQRGEQCCLPLPLCEGSRVVWEIQRHKEDNDPKHVLLLRGEPWWWWVMRHTTQSLLGTRASTKLLRRPPLSCHVPVLKRLHSSTQARCVPHMPHIRPNRQAHPISLPDLPLDLPSPSSQPPPSPNPLSLPLLLLGHTTHSTPARSPM